MNTGFKMLVTVSVMFLAACTNDSKDIPFTATDNSQFSFQNDSETKTLTKDEQDQLNKFNEFGFSVCKLIQDKSYCFSPLSAGLLLGMLAEGAEGSTRSEILAALGAETSGNADINSFARAILSISRSSKNSEFDIANAVFLAKNTELKKDYLKTSKEYYDAYVSSLDFSDNKSLGIVNGWVSDQTHGLINHLLDYLDSNLFAYFISSLYFKGQWSEVFDDHLTGVETFKKSVGAEKQVPMMKKSGYLYVAEAEGFRIAQLPYSGGDFLFNIILPQAEGNESGLLDKLDAAVFTELLNGLKNETVDLWLPKFNLSTKTPLNPLLNKCGIQTLFLNPDLSNMCSSIDDEIILLQRSQINIDENGTEAAAVTYNEDAVDPPLSPDLQSPVIFHADRPFSFIVTHRATGAILFMGSYDGD